MKIKQTSGANAILSEMGNRIKQQRISLNITQQQFAEKCDMSVSTLKRIENGDDAKFSAIIKILYELNLTENLNLLIPEPQPDYKALFEEKATRKRARPDKKKTDNAWVWGEDKEDE